MKFLLLAVITLILSLSSCKKDEPSQTSGSPVIPDVVESLVEPGKPAKHLGFAKHVPADVDLFLAGYGADEMTRVIFEGLTKTFIEVQTLTKEEADADSEAAPATDDDKVEWIDEAIPYIGDEAFVFVGQGPGELLKVATSSYRDLSATSLGMTAGLIIDAFGDGDPLKAMEGQDELLQDMSDRLFEALQKDSSLHFPSIVTGWKPHPDKRKECITKLNELIDAMMVNSPTMKPVSFDAFGVSMKGYQGSGGEMFSEMIQNARQAIEDAAQEEQVDQFLSDPRIEELLEALENFEFTITCGALDDYVLIYLGNGNDGFRLAETANDSLATAADITWTNPFAEETITSFAYASESFVKAWLPLIDSGPYWDALAQAVTPATEDARAICVLLESIADTEHRLAERNASSWSAIAFLDEGLRVESRGGWPNPDLDYTAPLRLTGPASATHPAIRAHWVQKRPRNNLEWNRIEQFGTLIQLGFEAYGKSELGKTMEVPEELAQQVMSLIKRLNDTYRDDFRNGIGDEQAFVLDFHGMTPPIPGIPEEIVAELELPRFLLARPVTDREKLATAAEEFVKASHELITMSNQASGLNLPLLEPQLVESNEFDTWYYPLPISGGDFIPGVSINDQLWMVGTSRSMAKAFSNGPASSGNEAGAIIDIDFEAMGQWIRNSYSLMKDQADELSDQAPDLAKDLATEGNLKSLTDGYSRLKAFHYRHWMDRKTPRTSYHLRIAPKSRDEE